MAEAFPGLGMSHVPDIIWWAEESTRLVEIPADLTAPKHIRQWHREPGQKCSEWVAEGFPGLGERAASAAIWYASNSEATSEIPADLTHPVNIRQWHREQQAANDPAQGELKDDPPPLWEVTQEMAEKCLRAST